ncbi:hypothetical protein [Ornithinimicrobium kibberense]
MGAPWTQRTGPGRQRPADAAQPSRGPPHTPVAPGSGRIGPAV